MQSLKIKLQNPDMPEELPMVGEVREQAEALIRSSSAELSSLEGGLVLAALAMDSLNLAMAELELSASPESKTALVGLKLTTNDITGARQMVDSLAATGSENNLQTAVVLTVLADIATDSLPIQSLSAQQIADLNSIADANTAISPLAHSILYSAGITDYQLPIEDYEDEIQVRQSRHYGFFGQYDADEKMPPSDGFFKLYPNPNDGSFRVDFENENQNSSTTLKIIDLTGKVVHMLNSTDNSGRFLINIQSLDNGIYMYEFWVGCELMSRDKITVIK